MKLFWPLLNFYKYFNWKSKQLNILYKTTKNTSLSKFKQKIFSSMGNNRKIILHEHNFINIDRDHTLVVNSDI